MMLCAAKRKRFADDGDKCTAFKKPVFGVVIKCKAIKKTFFRSPDE